MIAFTAGLPQRFRGRGPEAQLKANYTYPADRTIVRPRR